MELRGRCLVQESHNNITQQPRLALNRTFWTRNQSLIIQRIPLLQSDKQARDFKETFRNFHNRPWAVLQNWRELWERSLQCACSPQTWPGDSLREDSDSVRSVTETHEVATPANACVSRNLIVLDACWRKETKVSTQDKYDISCWSESLETLKLSVSKIPFQAVSHVTSAAKSLFVESNDRPYGVPGKILISSWLGKMGGNSKAWPWCQWLEFEWLPFEWLPQWRLSWFLRYANVKQLYKKKHKFSCTTLQWKSVIRQSSIPIQFYFVSRFTLTRVWSSPSHLD